MSRQTRPAYALTDNTYAMNNGVVKKIVKAFTFADRTTLIDGNGDSWRISSTTPMELATEDEAAEYERQCDRLAVAAALAALGEKIVARGLPVPAGGQGIVVSFDVDDLEPWSRYVSKRPQRGTSRPLVQAEAEGVEVYVYGPGTSGEFGPDLADAALTESVEHGDSVGAFPVVAMRSAEACLQAERNDAELRRGGAWGINREGCTYEPDCPLHGEKPKPERDGFAPPSGHAVVLPPDALKHDGRYDDNRGTEA